MKMKKMSTNTTSNLATTDISCRRNLLVSPKSPVDENSCHRNLLSTKTLGVAEVSCRRKLLSPKSPVDVIDCRRNIHNSTQLWSHSKLYR